MSRNNGEVSEDGQAAPFFEIGDGYAAYRGPIGAGSLHRHAAFQITTGTGSDVTVLDGCGHRHQAETLIVAPMVEHCLQASADVTTYFVEPHCTFADGLRRHHGASISAATDLRVDAIPSACMAPSTQLDSRLVEALSVLSGHSVSLDVVARRVGLSTQRLRALARHDLGMPLTRWRVWTRLRRAVEAVQAGQSLAEAAVTAGFADQAHFTRQMCEMMGVTPAAVLPLIRSHSLEAT